ncbi:MAG: O-antigen ligase family protein [Halothece sp.]
MVGLIRFSEKVLVVLGLLYLTESFFVFIPGTIASLIQYGVYLVTFLLLLARWRRTIRTAIRNIFIWILLSIALFSFLWSDFPSQSLISSIVAWQTASFALYFASCYTLKQQIRLLAWAMGIAAVLTLVYTLVNPGSAIHFGAHAGAWRGVYTHKNVLAQMMTLSSLVFLFLVMTLERHRYLAWGGLILSVALLILSTSKTGLVVFLTVFVLLQLYKTARWRNTKAILGAIIVTLIVSGLFTILIGNFESVLTSLGRDPTLTGRTEIWGGAIEWIQEKPWLGYGRSAFWEYESGRPVAVGEAVGAKYVPPHSHNGFIDLTGDLGLVGLGAFLLSFLTGFIRAYNRVRFTRSPENIWPVVYLSFFILYNLTETSIMGHNSGLWAIYITVLLSLNRFDLYSPVTEDPETVSSQSLQLKKSIH